MRALVAWSSGKDSAWTLHALRQRGVEVAGLLTTFGERSGEVVAHGVPRPAVEAQARALGLPLLAVALPEPCPNAVYEERLRRALARARDLGVTHVAFGDLFLEDVRAYRERLLEGTGVAPLFPLWGEPTEALARRMLAAGLRAIVVAVDAARLDAGFAGRTWDERFLADLPQGIDPCGERGEFHTFCHAGPLFREPVPVRVAGTVVGGREHRARLELGAPGPPGGRRPAP